MVLTAWYHRASHHFEFAFTIIHRGKTVHNKEDTISDLKSLGSALIKVFKQLAPPGSSEGKVLALHHLVLYG